MWEVRVPETTVEDTLQERRNGQKAVLVRSITYPRIIVPLLVPWLAFWHALTHRCPRRDTHVVGYARVSTPEQKLDRQRDALQQAGCDRIFTDVSSGALADRPGLTDALAFLRVGDSLVIWKLDRLRRSGLRVTH